eukprot:2445492-Rhodomonas_salina.1
MSERRGGCRGEREQGVEGGMWVWREGAREGGRGRRISGRQGASACLDLRLAVFPDLRLAYECFRDHYLRCRRRECQSLSQRAQLPDGSAGCSAALLAATRSEAQKEADRDGWKNGEHVDVGVEGVEEAEARFCAGHHQ